MSATRGSITVLSHRLASRKGYLFRALLFRFFVLLEPVAQFLLLLLETIEFLTQFLDVLRASCRWSPDCSRGFLGRFSDSLDWIVSRDLIESLECCLGGR